MTKLFVCTSNAGKQEEIRNFLSRYANKNIKLYFPDKDSQLQVEETAQTYKGNALLKARAYFDNLNDKTMIFVGDDSGIRIPALNGEPGVMSRRWAGYEMTDVEILNYALKKMRTMYGSKRDAVFETVVVAIHPDKSTHVYEGNLWGSLLENPKKQTELKGFPFRETFWIKELNKTWQDAVSLGISERQGFLTNREIAFKKLFEEL